MPKVSVVMPAYNAEKYIKRAVESVILQTYRDWELIIVDDYSEDDTGLICDNFSSSDCRIKTIHMSRNLGISEAKNRAMLEAKGY